MDVYYKEFDGGALSAAKHLSATAARFAYSMVRAIPNLPDAIYVEFRRLLTVESLWALGIVLADWFIATVLGGPIGIAVNGVLIVYGLGQLWDELKEIASDLKS